MGKPMTPKPKNATSLKAALPISALLTYVIASRRQSRGRNARPHRHCERGATSRGLVMTLEGGRRSAAAPKRDFPDPVEIVDLIPSSPELIPCSFPCQQGTQRGAAASAFKALPANGNRLRRSQFLGR